MTDANDLTCQELVELVTMYLEGEFPTPASARFDAHLTACTYCRDYLDQIRQTIRALGRLREEDLVPPARDRLLAAFHDWKHEGGDTASR